MDGYRLLGLVLTSLSLLSTTRAAAHFRLVQPPSWLNEDSLGGPQKGSPCGPGNKMLIIGDDVEPIPLSNTVTTFQAGETIDLHLEETVYHPGYFRVSLAHAKPAEVTTSELPNPPLTDTMNCHYDTAAVQTGAHGNVLADGLFMADAQSATNRSLTQQVKLPSEPCEGCTLQVVQVMEGHPGSSCFYFHCAEINIVAAQPADAGVTGEGTARGDAGTPVGLADAGPMVDASRAASDASDSHDAAKEPAQKDDGGCSVGAPGKDGAAAAVWCLWTAVALLIAGRRRTRRARSA